MSDLQATGGEQDWSHRVVWRRGAEQVRCQPRLSCEDYVLGGAVLSVSI